MSVATVVLTGNTTS